MFRAVLDFELLSALIHIQRPCMVFLFVGSWFCPRVSMFPASGFLQIPPRDGHPCLRLTFPTAKYVAVFHRLVPTHAGYTQKRPKRYDPAFPSNSLFLSYLFRAVFHPGNKVFGAVSTAFCLRMTLTPYGFKVHGIHAAVILQCQRKIHFGR